MRLTDAPGPILAGAVGLIGLKAALTFGLAWLLRLAPRVALETALLIGPSGEFAFVIIGSGMAAGLVPSALGQSGPGPYDRVDDRHPSAGEVRPASWGPPRRREPVETRIRTPTALR